MTTAPPPPVVEYDPYTGRLSCGCGWTRQTVLDTSDARVELLTAQLHRSMCPVHQAWLHAGIDRATRNPQGLAPLLHTLANLRAPEVRELIRQWVSARDADCDP